MDERMAEAFADALDMLCAPAWGFYTEAGTGSSYRLIAVDMYAGTFGKPLVDMRTQDDVKHFLRLVIHD